LELYCLVRIDRSNKRIRGAMAALVLFLLFDSGCSAKDNETVQLIVKFNESASETQRNNLHNQIGKGRKSKRSSEREVDRLRPTFGQQCARFVHADAPDLHHLFVVALIAAAVVSVL
jgi:hypothetical protein